MLTTAISVPVSSVDVAAEGVSTARQDFVAVEEPLQIRIGRRQVAVTMRTPGHDRELSAGFLFTEGILNSPEQIESISPGAARANTRHQNNEIVIRLQKGIRAEIARRNFYLTSSCGVCGKASVEAVHAQGCRAIASRLTVDAAILNTLPEKLREAQATFARTGGLHAAGLFDSAGTLEVAYEDVGRHNALDKLIGDRFLAGALPLDNQILVVSGRTSFELVQKAVMAGIPVLAAVGAPSSLAVALAVRFNVSLCGFVRGSRFNVYAGQERIVLPVSKC